VKSLQMASYKSLALVLAVSVLLAACAAPATKESEPKPDKAKAAAVSPEVSKKYEAALKAMRDDDKPRAEQLLTQLTNAYPKLSGPYTNLGILYYRESKVDEAEKAFQSAIQVNPNSAVSYNHLGIINRNKGQFKEAEQLYEKALQINPDYAYAHLNLGILLDLYIGDLPKALEHYNRYQSLSKEKDEEVHKWIVDLERRIKRANKKQ
jgi:lipoprotein NlpI